MRPLTLFVVAEAVVIALLGALWLAASQPAAAGPRGDNAQPAPAAPMPIAADRSPEAHAARAPPIAAG